MKREPPVQNVWAEGGCLWKGLTPVCQRTATAEPGTVGVRPPDGC